MWQPCVQSIKAAQFKTSPQGHQAGKNFPQGDNGFQCNYDTELILFSFVDNLDIRKPCGIHVDYFVEYIHWIVGPPIAFVFILASHLYPTGCHFFKQPIRTLLLRWFLSCIDWFYEWSGCPPWSMDGTWSYWGRNSEIRGCDRRIHHRVNFCTINRYLPRGIDTACR